MHIFLPLNSGVSRFCRSSFLISNYAQKSKWQKKCRVQCRIKQSICNNHFSSRYHIRSVICTIADIVVLHIRKIRAISDWYNSTKFTWQCLFTGFVLILCSWDKGSVRSDKTAYICRPDRETSIPLASYQRWWNLDWLQSSTT